MAGSKPRKQRIIQIRISLQGNISDMTNKSRGEVAYTMLDVEEAPTEEIIRALEAIGGVFRVRIVKG